MDDTHTRAHDDTQVLLESGEGGGDVEVSAQLRDFAANVGVRSNVISTMASTLFDMTNKALLLTKVRTCVCVCVCICSYARACVYVMD